MMPEKFDPYLKWLGIPPKHQPPNHYRLLGLEPLEDDPDVIESAADRQMAHVRTFSTGKRMELAEQLLKELAEARVALVNADKKTAYDKKLRASLRKTQQAGALANEGSPTALPSLKAAIPIERAPAAPPAPRPKAVVVAPSATPQAAAQPAAPLVFAGRRSGAARRRNKSTLFVLAIAGAGGLLLCLLAAIVVPGLIAPPVAAVTNPPPRDPPTRPASSDDHNAATAGEPVGRVPVTDASSTPLVGDASPRKVEPVADPEPAVAESDGGSGSNPPNSIGEENVGEESVPPDEPTKQSGTPTGDNGSDIAGEPTRPQPPLREKQVEIEARIRQLYPVSTTTSAQDNTQLAGKLIEDAAQTLDNDDDRYTMLSMAADLAAGAADLQTASRAIDEIQKHYDADAASMRLDAVQRAAKAAPPETKAEVIRGSLAVLDGVMQQSRYRDAEKTSIALLGLARRLSDRDLNKALVQRRQQAKTLGDMHEQAIAGIATLTKDPQNAAANTTVGSFWIFAKGNWEQGLPHLAKGDDATLAEVAQRELDSPEKASDQAEIGNLWFQGSQREEPLRKDIMLRRAKHWYERSQDGLTGLARTTVERRLEEIEAALNPVDLSQPKVRVAEVFAAGDSSFEMYLNGQLLTKAGLFEGTQRADCELKSGDIITVIGEKRFSPRGFGRSSERGFAAVIKFDEGDPIVTGQAGTWRVYTPANPTLWYDPRGITNLANPVAGDSDRLGGVESQSGVASVPIWGADRYRSYFVLQIP